MPNTVPSQGGTLYVAATPLGNLQDISARLRQTLSDVDFVLAEDTRRSRVLLSHLGLHKPLHSLHSHNELHKVPGLLARLEAGESAVLISDAGTPGVSDPGVLLVAAAHVAGLTVCPIAGPSALTAALSVCGYASGPQGMLFVGFLPRQGAPRQAALDQIAAHHGLVVVFESPERLGKTLRALQQDDAQRPICLCRELTKLHEEVRCSTVAQLAEHYADVPPKGEITFVLGPKTVALPLEGEAGAPALTLPPSLDAAVHRALGVGLSAKDTAAALAALFDVPKKTVYSLAVAQKNA